MTILIANKVDFRAENVIREQDHFLMIEASVHQDDPTVLNIHALNNRTSKYMRQKYMVELHGETDKSTTVVRNFNTPSQ